MGENDETDHCLDRRSADRNYYGVERRSGLDQGKFIVVTVYRSVFYGLLAFNIVLSLSVVNLTFFANKGARYTAADGAREQAERIQGDQDLQARIDALHRQAWNQE